MKTTKIPIMGFDELMEYIDCATINQKWFIMQYLEYKHGVKVQTAKDKEAKEWNYIGELRSMEMDI